MYVRSCMYFSDTIQVAYKITADGDSNHKNQKTPASWEESDDKPRQHLKKQRHHLADKGPNSQTYGFSSSDVWK